MRFYDEQQEVDLIAAYQKGTAENILPLLDAYQSLLYVLARRLCCPYAMIEELVQSGYIGLLRAAKRFNPGYKTRFITYAVPWILGEMKKTMRVFLSGSDDLALDNGNDRSHPSLLETLCSGNEIDLDRIDLRNALLGLTEEERKLVYLRYFRDHTQSEAAKVLQKSQAQISRMERKVLDALKKSLS